MRIKDWWKGKDMEKRINGGERGRRKEKDQEGNKKNNG